MKLNIRKIAVMAMAAASSVALNAVANDFTDWAQTPPMGWNSFDCHGSSVTESQVIANAEKMVTLGMMEKGWEYCVVDIRWYTDDNGGYYNQSGTQVYTLDEYGRYLPDAGRFPSSVDGNGFKALADQLHEMGLKFGIHVMRGVPRKAVEQKCPILGTDGITCDLIANEDSLCVWLSDNLTVDCTKDGAQEYYNSIIDLYAQWGVDFIKVDDLSRPYHDGEIAMIRSAIDQCGRPIVLSMSPGQTPLTKAESCQQNANMWRMMDDFWDRWSDMQQEFQLCEKWNEYRTDGCWPDCDMLPLGRLDMGSSDTGGRWTKFTHDEQQTMMTLWSIFRSPLMMGGDLRFNDDWTNSLLLNGDMIYVNQHSTNNRLVSNDGTRIIWAADDPYSDAKYVALFNAGDLGGYVPYNTALWSSQTITGLTDGYGEDCDITLPDGTTQLALVVDDAGDGNNYDHGDFINPIVTLKDGSTKRLNSHSLIDKDLSQSYYNYVNFNKSLTGGKLSVNGITYNYGVSAHANAMLLFEIPEDAVSFSAFCALDDSGRTQEGSTSSVRFLVFDHNPLEDVSTEADEVITLDLQALGFPIGQKCEVIDIWGGESLGEFESGEFAPTISKHACRFLKLIPVGDGNGISTTIMDTLSDDSSIYSIDGRRLSSIPRHGLYIQSGHTHLSR